MNSTVWSSETSPFLHPLAYAADVDRDDLGSEEDGPRGVAEPFGGSHDVGPRPSGVGALESERVAFAEVALDLVVDKLAGGALERRVVGVAEAFEEICNRFNLFLARLWNRKGEKHRGLVVMDKSHYEETLQGLARRFRDQGTRWGNLRNLAEVPLFVDSAASRLIQIADLLAWAVWRRYEFADTRYFDRIVRRFDTEGGVMHGLVHFKPPAEQCMCPACLSRTLRGTAGRSAGQT